MNTPGLPYRIAAGLSVPLVPFIMRSSEAREAHRSRLDAVAALVAWGKRRDQQRPLAWFHAASVGEGLQAEAVLTAFRARHPDALVVFTHYSPSATSLAKRVNADWAGFLPYDRQQDVIPVIEALKPDLLVFTKVDLWPELACQAAARKVRVALVAATVEPGSSRLRWPARAVSHPGYQALHVVGAISRADAERLLILGVHPDRMVVTGDPRVDSVLTQLEKSKIAFPFPDFQRDRILIAGSTWPADEAVLLAAFAEIRKDFPEANLIIVPHQPTADHLRELDSAIVSSGLPPAVRLSNFMHGTSPSLLVVDRVGVLASLYPLAAIAYVGGGFGHRGIHSVLEPAAAGCAIIVGPNDRGSRDVALLTAAGALAQVKSDTAVSDLVSEWSHWLSAPKTALEAGAWGRRELEAERGAAERSADLLDSVLAAVSS